MPRLLWNDPNVEDFRHRLGLQLDEAARLPGQRSPVSRGRPTVGFGKIRTLTIEQLRGLYAIESGRDPQWKSPQP